MKRSLYFAGSLLLCGASLLYAAAPNTGVQLRELPASKASLLASEPGFLAHKVAPGLEAATGRVEVIVRLATPAVAELDFPEKAGVGFSAHKSLVEDKQLAFVDRSLKIAPDAKLLGRVQMVLNAVFLEVDAAAIAEIAKDPAVIRIALVRNYEMALSQTVPQIGADLVQAEGFDGSGISLAVLDSGIDYTHAAFGGAGTLAAYEAAYGTSTADPLNTTRDGLFPTAKVVEGFDFVGEEWPNGPLAQDEDPIDFEGHGTHVADIAGGLSGVAPGVDLYAVKVCSAVSSACSGVALIQGMDYVVDPNGDGDTSDRIDVVNMSLGADYGQAFDDDLSQAVENATALGVLSVAAAGNGGDNPYIAGTPGNAPTAISVAQTDVASSLTVQAMTVTEPVADAGDYLAVFQTWSVPLAGVISGAVQYGDGVGGNLDGCAAFAPGSLAGQIVYIDRGVCNFTLKIKNVGDAGGVLGIIGTIDDTAPFAGADGGDAPITIPGFMIGNADADILRSGLGVVTFDPANQFVFTASMVASSSRGPASKSNSLKPEIGAPGGAVSAEAGTGTGLTQFGGTSGASPHVAGAAAQLLQANSSLRPLEVKAILMGAAETDVVNALGGDLAAISRVGAGEVRVHRAFTADAAAWGQDVPTGGASFGFHDVDRRRLRLTQKLTVRNYSNHRVRYEVKPVFRFADDEATDAVDIRVSPRRVTVQAGGHRTVRVRMTIESDNLRDNLMNAGSEGANPAVLTANEYDGYLLFEPIHPSADAQPFQVPWHVLPRKAARVVASDDELDFDGGDTADVTLRNRGRGTAQNDSYSLLGLSPNLPEGGAGAQAPTPDLRAFGVQTFAGFEGCGEYVLAFALTTWERQSIHFPGVYSIFLDTNQDGSDDYLVQNGRLDDFGVAGDNRNVAAVFDLVNGGGSFFFFTENATNTANSVLLICASQIGDVPLFQNIDATVTVDDFYYGGPGDALAAPVTFAPLGERYVTADGFGSLVDIPGGDHATMTVFDFGPAGTNPSEIGILLFTNGDRGATSRGGATAETEALVFTVDP